MTDASSGASGGSSPARDGAAGTPVTVKEAGSADAGCGNTRCDPWWDPSFTHRRKLTFARALEPEDVSGLPVLVRLDATRIEYGATRPLGEDLRFIDDDGATVLPHEIERWDPQGVSIVWVRVPKVDGGTDLDHVFMYYGSGAAPDAQQRSAVWSGYDAVYHLADLSDSAGKQPAITDHGSAVATGGIGGARRLDGVASYLDLGSNLAVLQGASTSTLSLRVRVNSVVGERALLSISVNSATPTGLSRAFVSLVGAIDVRAGGRSRDTDALSSFLTTTGSPLVAGAPDYVHVTAILDLGAQEIRLFVNGAVQTTDALSTPFTASVMDSTPSSFNVLGASDDMGSQYLDGDLDEVRIAPAARSPAFVRADARSEADDLLRFGPDEPF